MRLSIHRFSLLLGAMLCTLSSLAFNIRGSVRTDEGEMLQGATVRLLHASDSSFVKGTKTNQRGRFIFQNVNNGHYIVETVFLGLANTYRDVKVRDKDVSLDTISMGESSVQLREVSVLGVKTQIKVMEDTVEYNADSYRTQPNAVVEDLLKRLPGVDVDSEGKITANGKEVKKILVDGKEFFSDDPKVASKNLPVDMVDKLQVVDRKSDLARITGVDDGEEETVINLTVKKGMKNGYFGNAEAGYGTDDRYKATFNVNKFWNDNQVTLLGNFNNINELGFTDSNGNRFMRFGGTNGINTSDALGLNFNVGNKEIFRVGGNVMYSHSSRYTTREQHRTYHFEDSASYLNSARESSDKGHNFRADFRMQWNPDSFNVIEFRPRISYNRNDSWSNDSSLTMAGDRLHSRVNHSLNNNDSKGKSLEVGGELIYNHKFRNHPGRSFSIQLQYEHSNVREYSNSFSRNIFYLLNDSIDLYDQYADNHTWSDNMQVRASWTEPLGNVKNGNFLTFAYRLQYRWNDADKMVYDHPVIWPDGFTGDPVIDYDQLIFSDILSNSFRNEYMNQDIRLGFQHVSKKQNLNVGLSLVPSMLKSEDLINSERNIPTRNVLNFAPFLRYRYKMSNSRSLQANYNGRSSQPSISQLQPVADMSDPLRIVVGNPDLKPTFRHNFQLRFQDFNLPAQRSIMLMANISASQNSIVSMTTFNQETGGQITTYTNVNGAWNGMLMSMISMPLRNKRFQFNNHLSTSYNQSIGYNNGNRNRNNSLRIGESLGLAFRPDNIELELRPNYSFQTTYNSIGNTTNQTIHTYGGSFRAYYYTPIGVILNTDVSYTGTSGYSQGYNRNEWMWNASISYQMLRDKSLTLALKAYDLLQQRSNISQTNTGNYDDETIVNSLNRYFMFSLSYRFNTFGKGNQPQSRNGRDGHDGPGRPGGGPGGGGGFGRGPR